MSLVAYDASSDEDSDCNEEETTKAIIIPKTAIPNTAAVTNGHISDEDDDYIPAVEEDYIPSTTSISRLLPKPKNETNLAELLENFAKPTFAALPTPSKPLEIEEEDDEFLHKKVPIDIIEKPVIKPEIKKMPVQITIPSLRNFTDVEKEMADKAKNKSTSLSKSQAGCSGLLSILPKAKSEQNFAKQSNSSGTVDKKMPSPAFVPDTVRHRRPATNTEDVDRLKPTNKAKLSNKQSIKEPAKPNDSDESGDDDDDACTSHETGDFFSFNTVESLPEVSITEINKLVAKKAAKMAETTTNYLKAADEPNANNEADEHSPMDQQELEASRKRYHQEQQLNPEAIQALVGGNSIKRRRQQKELIQVIDINSDQVLPDRDEWMRTALASSTTYQPTGVLVDEEPASGTRRKHQITYLAHKAKANEAELQAMWSANRQNRRATQSKYGF